MTESRRVVARVHPGLRIPEFETWKGGDGWLTWALVPDGAVEYGAGRVRGRRRA